MYNVIFYQMLMLFKFLKISYILSFFFLITKLYPDNLLYCPCFFLLTKNLILALLLLKWNQTCFIKFFLATVSVSFYKLLNINLDGYSLCVSHLKWFFDGDSEWTEKTTSASFQDDHKLIYATTNIQLRKFRFKEGVKLV